MFDILDHENDPYLNQYLMGPNAPQTAMPSPAPVDRPMTNALFAAAPPIRPQDQTPIEIDAWKPHKRTTLGTIADIGLALLGLPIAPFKRNVDRQNMQEVMQGFTHDPLQTIQRLATLPGHEGDALSLYDKYIDNQRMQGNLDRQNNVFDLQKEKYVYDRVASMMQAGSRDAKTWTKMRDFATNYANRFGVDVSSIIPESLDPDSIEFIRAGSVPVAKQEQLNETHDYHTERLEDFDNAEAGKNARSAASRAATESRFQRSQAAQESRFKRSEAGKDRRASSAAGVPEGTLQRGDGKAVPQNVARRLENGKWTYYLIKSDGKYYRMKDQSGKFGKK